jgi:prophage antirepressor-like protein
VNFRAYASNVQLSFQNHPLDLIEIDGENWVRGQQIADALGYKNPRQAIDDLYTRNESEFTEHMTRVVDLPTAGGVQQVRVFTLRGAHLLGMLARTPVAASFRRWILDVLDGIVAPQETGRMTFPQRLGYLKFRTQLLKELGRCTSLGEANELFVNLRDVTRLLGMHLASTLEQLAPGVRQQLLALEGGAA